MSAAIVAPLLSALLGLPDLPSVSVYVIPHAEQRYVGTDWQWQADGGLVIRVSDLGDSRFNLLIAAHELVESLLCRRDGVTEAAVDAWDLAHTDEDEPGEVEGCPYFSQHEEASWVERELADLMGVDWDEYSESFERFGEKDRAEPAGTG